MTPRLRGGIAEHLELSETDTEAVLEAETTGGVAIVGTDVVRIVPEERVGLWWYRTRGR